MNVKINLLAKSIDIEIYKSLIKQLNRDLILGGIDLKINESRLPNELILELTGLIKNLIQNEYQTFNQFLYTLDVSEKKIHNLTETNLEKLTPQIVKLILERLLQKVILKRQFKNT